jgi:hypothetical protein
MEKMIHHISFRMIDDWPNGEPRRFPLLHMNGQIGETSQVWADIPIDPVLGITEQHILAMFDRIHERFDARLEDKANDLSH